MRLRPGIYLPDETHVMYDSHLELPQHRSSLDELQCLTSGVAQFAMGDMGRSESPTLGNIGFKVDSVST